MKSLWTASLAHFIMTSSYLQKREEQTQGLLLFFQGGFNINLKLHQFSALY